MNLEYIRSVPYYIQPNSGETYIIDQVKTEGYIFLSTITQIKQIDIINKTNNTFVIMNDGNRFDLCGYCRVSVLPDGTFSGIVPSTYQVKAEDNTIVQDTTTVYAWNTMQKINYNVGVDRATTTNHLSFNESSIFKNSLCEFTLTLAGSGFGSSYFSIFLNGSTIYNFPVNKFSGYSNSITVYLPISGSETFTIGSSSPNITTYLTIKKINSLKPYIPV